VGTVPSFKHAKESGLSTQNPEVGAGEQSGCTETVPSGLAVGDGHGSLGGDGSGAGGSLGGDGGVKLETQ